MAVFWIETVWGKEQVDGRADVVELVDTLS